jgi:hypothetical protein
LKAEAMTTHAFKQSQVERVTKSLCTHKRNAPAPHHELKRIIGREIGPSTLHVAKPTHRVGKVFCAVVPRLPTEANKT